MTALNRVSIVQQKLFWSPELENYKNMCSVLGKLSKTLNVIRRCGVANIASTRLTSVIDFLKSVQSESKWISIYCFLSTYLYLIRFFFVGTSALENDPNSELYAVKNSRFVLPGRQAPDPNAERELLKIELNRYIDFKNKVSWGPICEVFHHYSLNILYSKFIQRNAISYTLPTPCVPRILDSTL